MAREILNMLMPRVDEQYQINTQRVGEFLNSRCRSIMKRVALIALGCLFVAMAIIGVIVPGIPATPWALAASYCFDRSSPRLHRWLRRTPMLGPLIADWEERRGMRPQAKATAVMMIVLALSYTVVISAAPVWVKWCAGGFGSLGICVILFAVRTLHPLPIAPVAVAAFDLPRFPSA